MITLIPTRKIVAIAAVLFVAAFGLYAPSLAFGFIDYDDYGVLLRHSDLYGQSSVAACLRAIFIEALPREEPLLVRDITWVIDAQLFGHENPFGHHLGNVLLNALNAPLLFLFLLQTTKRWKFAAAVAALFAILPLHVEPVAWVMGRKDVLSAFFVLCALNAEALAYDAKSVAKGRIYYAIALLLVPLALFSKLSAVSLVPLLFLYRLFRPYLDHTIEPQTAFDRKRILQAALRFAPHAVVTWLAVRWYGGVVEQFGVLDRSPPLSADYVGTLLAYWPLVFAKYFELMITPFDMSIAYEWPTIGLALEPLEIATAIVVYPVALAATYYFFRRRRDLLFYWLGFFTLMIPYLNLRYIGIWIGVRYVYFASFCLLAIGAELIAAALKSPVRALRLAAASFSFAVVAIYLVQTPLHLGVFENDVALWEYETSRDRPAVMAFDTLARTYLTQAEAERDPQEAQKWLARAEETIDRGLARYESLKITPSTYTIYQPASASKLIYSKGELARMRGAPPETVLDLWRKAREVQPNDPLFPLSISQAYAEMAKAAEGEEKDRLARAALDEHRKFAILAGGDPLGKKEALDTLADVYAADFPQLCGEIRAMMEMIERGSSSRARCTN